MEELKERIVSVVFEIVQTFAGREDINSHKAWHEELKTLVAKTVSVRAKPDESKVYDIEIRTCPALLKRYGDGKWLFLTSNLGFVRELRSSREVAQLFLPDVEDACRRLELSNHVRIDSKSGFICVLSKHMMQCTTLDLTPCPKCPMWLKNPKSLWWHMLQQHDMNYCAATETANWQESRNETALVVYNNQQQQDQSLDTRFPNQTTPVLKAPVEPADDPWSSVKRGSLSELQKSLKNSRTFDPRTTRDSHGALLIHWAAGRGHSDILQYLESSLDCNLDEPQFGHRSFQGRTALHWAARNGHFHVVRYLLQGAHQQRLEATTADGTTAFCWAAWQGHHDVLELLYKHGCRVDTVNRFGCNAVLWASQGPASVETIAFLQQVGCSIYTTNRSGHGVLHKAAQRGRKDLCEWFLNKISSTTFWNAIGPDNDRATPSDLAGMEGHEELAIFLAEHEQALVKTYRPDWLQKFSQPVGYVWEPGSGLLRMRSVL